MELAQPNVNDITPSKLIYDLEQLEEDSKASGIDVGFKQLQPGIIHATAWAVVSRMCIVQYLAADRGVEALGSYPKEYTALHIALDKTILSQNGLFAHQNKWILLAPGAESKANSNLSCGGHVLIVFFHKKIIDSFKDYFEKDISYPKSSVINLYAGNTQSQRMIELAWQSKQYEKCGIPQHIINELTETFIDVLLTRISIVSDRALKNRQHKVKVFNFLRDYINANYSQSFSMHDLHSKANLTHRTMDRLFNAELGMSPLKYLLVCRLGAVREKLSDPAFSEMEISIIAQDSGFVHLGRFSQYFKQHYGICPREYRKQTQNFSLSKSK